MRITRQQAEKIADRGNELALQRAGEIAGNARDMSVAATDAMEPNALPTFDGEPSREALKLTSAYGELSRSSGMKDSTVNALADRMLEDNPILASKLSKAGPDKAVSFAGEGMRSSLADAGANFQGLRFGGDEADGMGAKLAEQAFASASGADMLGNLSADVVSRDSGLLARAASQAALKAGGAQQLSYDIGSHTATMSETGPNGDLHASGSAPSYASVSWDGEADLGWHKEGQPHNDMGMAIIKNLMGACRALFALNGSVVDPSAVMSVVPEFGAGAPEPEFGGGSPHPKGPIAQIEDDGGGGGPAAPKPKM